MRGADLIYVRLAADLSYCTRASRTGFFSFGKTSRLRTTLVVENV